MLHNDTYWMLRKIINVIRVRKIGQKLSFMSSTKSDDIKEK